MRRIRVLLSRKRGAKLPANTIVVARPSRWGNPFVIGAPLRPGTDSKPLTRAEAVAAFRSWLALDPEGMQLAADAKVELRGKNVACWCRLDELCHGDVWLEVANAK
jgi:hypothetical protein